MWQESTQAVVQTASHASHSLTEIVGTGAGGAVTGVGAAWLAMKTLIKGMVAEAEPFKAMEAEVKRAHQRLDDHHGEMSRMESAVGGLRDDLKELRTEVKECTTGVLKLVALEEARQQLAREGKRRSSDG